MSDRVEGKKERKKERERMSAPQPLSESFTHLVGDCELVFKHPVSYEPPLYLFPELLGKVPEGTAPVAVGDAVSDALVVESSFLNIAELFHLPSEDLRKGVGSAKRGAAAGDITPPQDEAEKTGPKVTLASLLASNRLQSIGLTAEVLQRGKFSSGAVIDELLKLKQRVGLNDDEAKVIMSNHFINLLAWSTAVEINSHQLPAKRGRESDNNGDAYEREEIVAGCNEKKRDRPCGDDGAGEIDIQTLQPSEDPWSNDVDIHPGTFVAAAEKDVEKRVELIENLTKLYRRPWRTLQSKGIQTDRLVPGVINETAPYVDLMKLPGAYLDGVRELGWKPAVHSNSEERCPWILQVTSTSVSDSQTIPVRGRVMHFGRTAGVVSSVSNGITNIHVGLVSLTQHPEFVSPHHFSLFLLPNKSSSSGTGEDSKRREDGGTEVQENEEVSQFLWLVNYGRNGVRVQGKQWTLGNMLRLEVGDVFYPTHDIRVVVADGLAAVGLPEIRKKTDEEGEAEAEVAVKPEPVVSLDG